MRVFRSMMGFTFLFFLQYHLSHLFFQNALLGLLYYQTMKFIVFQPHLRLIFQPSLLFERPLLQQIRF